MQEERELFRPKALKDVESLKTNINIMLRNLEKAYSYDNFHLDYSSDTLRILDRLNYSELHLRNRQHVNRTLAYVVEGAAFGEVVVRTLKGEWRYPSDFRISWLRFLLDFGTPFSLAGRVLFPYICVKLNGNLIPVMKIARLKMKLSERAFSFEKAYEEIKTTGKWLGDKSLTKRERDILRENRWLRRVNGRIWLYDPYKHNVHSLDQFIRHVKISRDDIRNSGTGGGFEYTRDGLKMIDKFFSETSLADILLKKEHQDVITSERDRRNIYNEVVRGVGGYLGETIVRNLDGEWQFPGREDFEVAWKLKSMEYLQERCFIKLGDNLIPIMTIAQLRLDEKIPSLVDVYVKIRTTGDWK